MKPPIVFEKGAFFVPLSRDRALARPLIQRRVLPLVVRGVFSYLLLLSGRSALEKAAWVRQAPPYQALD